MSDPTAGGRLAVEVVAGDTGKPVPDGVVDISSNGADCIVRPTADRVLTGPLMSLGAGPRSTGLTALRLALVPLNLRWVELSGG